MVDDSVLLRGTHQQLEDLRECAPSGVFRISQRGLLMHVSNTPPTASMPYRADDPPSALKPHSSSLPSHAALQHSTGCAKASVLFLPYPPCTRLISDFPTLSYLLFLKISQVSGSAVNSSSGSAKDYGAFWIKYRSH